LGRALSANPAKEIAFMPDDNFPEYPPAVAELLRQMPLAPLGPGTPVATMKGQLQAIEAAAFGGRTVNRDMANACQAGLWLAFHFLDESHTLSQALHTPEGSYWHALMHRREPDHANAAYWFRHVGFHPVFEPLCPAAAELASLAPPPGEFLKRQESWDPFAFNDLCATSHEETAPCHELCRRIQSVEWELLFAYCYRRAVGAGR
jgi:hypothetical protein